MGPCTCSGRTCLRHRRPVCWTRANRYGLSCWRKSGVGCGLQEPSLTANSKPSCVPARTVLPRGCLLGVEVVPYLLPILRQLSVSQRPLTTHSPNVHNGRNSLSSSHMAPSSERRFNGRLRSFLRTLRWAYNRRLRPR